MAAEVRHGYTASGKLRFPKIAFPVMAKPPPDQMARRSVQRNDDDDDE